MERSTAPSITLAIASAAVIAAALLAVARVGISYAWSPYNLESHNSRQSSLKTGDDSHVRGRPRLKPSRFLDPVDALGGRNASECLNSRKMIPLFFEHVPKTGTSFVNTLYRWGCGVSPENHSFELHPSVSNPRSHNLLPGTLENTPGCFGRLYLRPNNPLVPKGASFFGLAGAETQDPHEAVPVVDSQLGHVVQLFRDPKKRIISYFEYDLERHRELPCDGENVSACFSERQERFRSFVFRQGGQHMQLKATAGLYCRETQVPSPAELLGTAKKRLADYGFVGLTERFDESVILFHLKYGGCPERSQFENMRPTSYLTAPEGLPSPSNAYLVRGFVPYEEYQLLELAEQKFEEDAIQYGLYDPHRNPWYKFLYCTYEPCM